MCVCELRARAAVCCMQMCTACTQMKPLESWDSGGLAATAAAAAAAAACTGHCSWLTSDEHLSSMHA